MRALKLPPPEREYKFHPTRKWRIDFAWPDLHPPLAVECEGGTYTQGRHTRGTGFEKDLEKYNELSLLGWRLLRYTRNNIVQGHAIAQICKVFRELDGEKKAKT